MAEILLIVPAGWVQLDWVAVQNDIPDLNKANVENWIATNQLIYIQVALMLSGKIPPDAVVEAAKLLDDTYFLVRLG